MASLVLSIDVNDKGTVKVKTFREEVGRAQGAITGVTGKLPAASRQIGLYESSISAARKEVGAFRVAVGLLEFGLAALGISKLFKETIKATSDQESANAALAASLRATGNVVGYTRDQLDGLTESLQKTSTFADENITQAEAILATYTHIGHDVFPAATKAVLDYATKFTTDLPSAARKLGVALDNPEKGVARLSRQLGELSFTQKQMIKDMVESGRVVEAQGVLMDWFNSKFGGAAAADRLTFGGSIKALGVAFKNLFEGKENIEKFRRSIEGLIEVLETDAVKEFSSALSSGLIGALSKAVTEGIPMLNGLIATKAEFNRIFSEGPKTWAVDIGVGVDKMLTGYGVAFKKAQAFWARMQGDKAGADRLDAQVKVMVEAALERVGGSNATMAKDVLDAQYAANVASNRYRRSAIEFGGIAGVDPDAKVPGGVSPAVDLEDLDGVSDGFNNLRDAIYGADAALAQFNAQAKTQGALDALQSKLLRPVAGGGGVFAPLSDEDAMARDYARQRTGLDLTMKSVDAALALAQATNLEGKNDKEIVKLKGEQKLTQEEINSLPTLQFLDAQVMAQQKQLDLINAKYAAELSGMEQAQKGQERLTGLAQQRNNILVQTGRMTPEAAFASAQAATGLSFDAQVAFEQKKLDGLRENDRMLQGSIEKAGVQEARTQQIKNSEVEINVLLRERVATLDVQHLEFLARQHEVVNQIAASYAGAIVTSLSSIVDGTRSWKDALDDVLSQFVKIALQAALFTPLQNDLTRAFGGQLGTGGSGYGLGQVAGAIGGLFGFPGAAAAPALMAFKPGTNRPVGLEEAVSEIKVATDRMSKMQVTIVNNLTHEGVAMAMQSDAGKGVIVNTLGQDAFNNGPTRQVIRGV